MDNHHETSFSHVFKCDLNANRAKPRSRHFWFFLFLRGSQYARFAPVRVLCKIGKKLVLAGTCCELPASALLGGGIYLPHLNGIVVSPYARIADGVQILQQVTLGVDFNKDPYAAPQVGEGVLLGAGAKVVGGVVIGDGAKVGANAVVTHDVPAGATVVGANKILG